jgi:hypothetical protein
VANEPFLSRILALFFAQIGGVDWGANFRWRADFARARGSCYAGGEAIFPLSNPYAQSLRIAKVLRRAVPQKPDFVTDIQVLGRLGNFRGGGWFGVFVAQIGRGSEPVRLVFIS